MYVCGFDLRVFIVVFLFGIFLLDTLMHSDDELPILTFSSFHFSLFTLLPFFFFL